MTHLIFAAILILMPAPSPKWDETQVEYETRVRLIAQAVDVATEKVKPGYKKQFALATVITFWGESRFSPFVHAGQRRGDGGLAICMGGLHRLKMEAADWEALAGTDLESTTRCATVTVERLARAWGHCRKLDPKHSWLEAMTLYGTGRTCRPDETRWEPIFRDRGAKMKMLQARY